MLCQTDSYHHADEDCSYLDNGVVIHMKAGDVCVQRGTIHGWTNPGSVPARMYFILIGETGLLHDTRGLKTDFSCSS